MRDEFQVWSDAVCEQVRFWPDRKQIAEELRIHYEDRCKDLERLHYEPVLVIQRSLSAMGDPREVGQALDRVHKPWLGWLWEASRILAWTAAALVLLTLLRGGWPHWWGPCQDFWEEGGVELACPGSVQAGAYRLEVTEIRYVCEESGDQDRMYLRMTAFTPKFWLDGPMLDGFLKAVDSGGAVYGRDHGRNVACYCVKQQPCKTANDIYLSGLGDGLEWIEIRHEIAGWSFRIDLPREEGAL